MPVVLELSAEPGGCRRGDYLLFDTLEEAKEALAWDLVNGMGPYFAVWYGENINLHIIGKTGRHYQTIDMNPYIRYTIAGKKIQLPADKDTIDHMQLDGEPLGRALFGETIQDIKVEIDWSAVDQLRIPKRSRPYKKGKKYKVHLDTREYQLSPGYNGFE